MKVKKPTEPTEPTNDWKVRIDRDPKIEALVKHATNRNGSDETTEPTNGGVMNRQAHLRTTMKAKKPDLQSPVHVSDVVGNPRRQRLAMLEAMKKLNTRSILKKTSNLRGRSKSVNFDASVGKNVVRSKQPVDKKTSNANSIQQHAIVTGPLTSAKNQSLVGASVQKKTDDRNENISHRIQQNSGSNDTEQQRDAVFNPSTVTNKRNSAGILVQQNCGGRNGVGANIGNNDDENSARPNQAALAFSDIMVYENRIAALTQANTAKINRIQALHEERNGLLAQVATLNRINRSLTETVDLYQLNENQNADLPNELAKVKAENNALRERVAQSDKENFELKQEIKRNKSILATYSKNVLEEHNYHLN